jgi:hypothetical protein
VESAIVICDDTNVNIDVWFNNDLSACDFDNINEIVYLTNIATTSQKDPVLNDITLDEDHYTVLPQYDDEG